MTYAQMSTAQQLSSASRALYANVHEHLKMSCDGVDVHLPDGVSLESVGVVNVPSSYGGQNVWGVPSAQSGFAKADMSDGVIELYAFDSMTHGTKAMFFGTPARRLAQGSSIVLRTSKTLPMHIDGEAWTQPPCTVSGVHAMVAYFLNLYNFYAVFSCPDYDFAQESSADSARRTLEIS